MDGISNTSNIINNNVYNMPNNNNYVYNSQNINNSTGYAYASINNNIDPIKTATSTNRNALHPFQNNPIHNPHTPNATPPKTNSNKIPPSNPNASLALAILPDLPFLMHGSGDALPQNVHPSSVALLAQLIERYVSDLVSAAMDAHDVFTDGEVVGGGGCLPMPPFGYERSKTYSGNAHSRRGGKNKNIDDQERDEKLMEEIRQLDQEEEDDADDKQSIDSTSTTSTARRRKRRSKRKLEKLLDKRRKRSEIDYWDEPLPPPNEDDSESDEDSSDDDSDSSSDDSSDDSNNDAEEDSDESDDDAPLLLSSSSLRATNFARTLSLASAATGTSLNSTGNNNRDNDEDDDDDQEEEEEEDVLTSQWQGVLPLDLHSTQRTRKYYVTAPTAMDARSFIFPICHDALLYQRVKEVQASRRSIGREVVENQ